MTWVEKLDETFSPFERISHIGGYNSKGDFSIPSNEAIKMIEQGGYRLGIKIEGKIVKIIVGSCDGKKFLKTELDAPSHEILLSLPNFQEFSREKIGKPWKINKI